MKLGDKAEFEGAASSFRSTPVPRRGMAALEMETEVPEYAFPGARVICFGLHAGTKKKFRARVLKIRPTFPRIVVRFEATEDGTGTSAIELPEMRLAYVTMADIAQLY